MSFKDNLRKKIEINDLAKRIVASMGPPNSGRRIDKDLVRKLLAEGGYEKLVQRDMELYRLPPLADEPRLLVLDNDLAIYRTSVDDVVLRKSPVVKEMLNIRNVIKILNDADVVISKKEVSLNTLREELIAELDLTFSKDDIADLVLDGRSAVENKYAEGIQETLRLLADLLAYVPAPQALQAPHHTIWCAAGADTGRRRYGPVVFLDHMHNAVKRIASPVDPADPEEMARYAAVLAGKASPDQEGGAVFKALGQDVLEAHGMASA